METTNLTIKEWALDDRPREKLLSKGVLSLSDAELLAILIGSGSRNETAVALSKRILHSVQNNLQELGKLSIEQLISSFVGIGEAKAITIIAAMELGRRRKLSENLQRPLLDNSQLAFEYLSPLLSDLPHEEYWIVLLNNAKKVIAHYKIGQGGITSTSADVRLIARKALENNAISVILAHNHPSGNLQVSNADLSITQQIKKALKLFDITLIDHFILSGNTFLSFADECLLYD
jgi:DNA repair protein RadC